MKKIQIALVSKEALPVFYIINEFGPNEVYLVGTKESSTSIANIKRVAASMGIECQICLTKPNDMQDTMEVCERIHTQNGDDCEYRYNLTGGTKLMAIGALLCAQSHKAEIVYSESKSYYDMKAMKWQSLTQMLDIDTIIRLQGQIVKDKTVYGYDEERTQCAKDIMAFEKTSPKLYHQLIDFYIKYNRAPRDYDNKPFAFYMEDGSVEYNGKIVFESPYKHVYDMLFKGQWWETLVADAVAQWAGPDSEVWTNVRFEPKEKANGRNYDKNEIDVLVNIGNILLFVECKSGAFTQDNIYKLSTVAKTYGSYKSQSVMAVYSKPCVRQDFEEKAKESNIEFLVPNKKFSNVAEVLNGIVNSKKA